MTPALKSVPEAVRLLHPPLTRTRTHVGVLPDLSLTRTVNVKVVLGVPLAGDTVPPWTVIGPQDPARTGTAKPTSDAKKQVASAMAATMFGRERVCGRCKAVSVSWVDDRRPPVRGQ
jgi:hypothetical protein